MIDPDCHTRRHCEERSDEAIQLDDGLDCFASLAMTGCVTNRIVFCADIHANATGRP
jgi:hypothetical protein